MSARRVRLEHFGGWVRLGDDTLVALNRPLARRIGLDGGERWERAPTGPAEPLEVHVAVTSRCPVTCDGCYQSASSEGGHVARGELEATLRSLGREGVFTVAFGGGEPLTREDLGELATLARAEGLTPVVTTSGVGMSPERAKTLGDFAQVNVSHDGVGGGYGAVRGFSGAGVAERAIALLLAAGVRVGVNLVVTRQNLGVLVESASHLRALGVSEVQLLRYKPAGRAASLDYLSRRLRPEDLATLSDAVRSLSESCLDGFSVRVDCALVPLLSDALGDPAMLQRLGVFGCEAGRHLGAVRVDGARVGCSFAWWSDGGAEEFRSYTNDPPEPCARCSLREVCRGGCKVVTMHLEGAVGADPECPRVLRHRAAAGARGSAAGSP